MDNFERSSWFCGGLIVGLIGVIIMLVTSYSDYREQVKVFERIKEKNTELIERVNNLNSWSENLRQITARYVDLIDEFGCGRMTFVEERACMQKYKPQ